MAFGGQNASGYPTDSVYYQLHPESTPLAFDRSRFATTVFPRHSGSAVYDAPNGRCIVFGGRAPQSGYLNDVFEIVLENGWRRRSIGATGTAPSPRAGHSAIYDPAAYRMIVFGGEGNSGLLGDLSAITLGFSSSPWSAMAAEGTPPTARSGHTAIHDPVRNRMIVFGGFDGACRNDVWALSLSDPPTWSELVPAGTAPAPRTGHSAVYDPFSDRMIVFGGRDPSGCLSDLSILSLAGTPEWSQPVATGTAPPALESHFAYLDTWTSRMVVAGGRRTSGDTWMFVSALDLASLNWQTYPASTSPATALARDHERSAAQVPEVVNTAINPPVHAAVAHDTQRARMVSYGAEGMASFDFGGAPWQTFGASGGVAPSLRDAGSMIYDPLNDRFLLFGGFDAASGMPINDLWERSADGLGPWIPIAAGGEIPAARGAAAMVLDPVRRRLLLFGGGSGDWFETRFDDLWELPLDGPAVWNQLSPLGAVPTARTGASMVYDGRRDRMLVFGGDVGSALVHEIYSLSLSGTPAWTRIYPAVLGTEPRAFANVFYDHLRDRLVVWGGHQWRSQPDVRALSLDGVPAWSTIASGPTIPSSRRVAAHAYDPVLDRLIIAGGLLGNGSTRAYETLALSFGQPGATGVPNDEPRAPDLGIARLRFVNGAIEVVCAMPNGEPATLELFDLAGRRVAEAAFEGYAGERSIALAGGARASAGVYFARLRQGAATATRRAALLR